MSSWVDENKLVSISNVCIRRRSTLPRSSTMFGGKLSWVDAAGRIGISIKESILIGTKKVYSVLTGKNRVVLSTNIRGLYRPKTATK